jgi:HAD superfamily hydrolase (TIGR01549 family)
MSLYYKITTKEIEKRGVNLDEFLQVRDQIERDFIEMISGSNIGGGVFMAIRLFYRIGRYAGFSKLQSLSFTLHLLRKIAKIYKDAPLFDDVIPSLEKLKNAGFRLAIVSMASRKEISRMFTRYDISHYFEFVVSRNDVKKSKPDPEGVIKACKALDLPPDMIFMIGDLPFDVMAAESAGVAPVSVTTGLARKEVLEEVSPGTPIFPRLSEAVDWILDNYVFSSPGKA